MAYYAKLCYQEGVKPVEVAKESLTNMTYYLSSKFCCTGD